MVYNTIGFLCIIGGIALLIFLFIRKAPQVALIDVEHIPEQKEEEKKQQIMEQRLQRQLRNIVEKISQFLDPIHTWLKHRWGRMLDVIHRWEDRSKQHKKAELKQDHVKLGEHITELIAKGDALVEQGLYPEAEQVFIEVVSLDRRNVVVYRALAEIYTAMRQYDHAREVWKYIERLTSRDENVLTNLGMLYAAEQRHEHAYEHYREALALAPRNPRLLDLFIEECIIMKKRDEAREALNVLQSVNPENQKLKDFEERIEAIVE